MLYEKVTLRLTLNDHNTTIKKCCVVLPEFGARKAVARHFIFGMRNAGYGRPADIICLPCDFFLSSIYLPFLFLA